MDAIAQYFDRLKAWKRLPAYKAEPRVDAIIGTVLPRVLPELTGWEVDVLIPEFPLRLGTIALAGCTDTRNANRSFKADFFVRTKCGRNLLIEFKTDMSSRRSKQDEYLLAAQKAGLSALFDGIALLQKHSRATDKYRCLLEQLSRVGPGSLAAGDAIEIRYIQPRPPGEGHGWGFAEIAEAMRVAYPADPFIEAAADLFLEWGKEAAGMAG